MLAGTSDGSLVLWDLREPAGSHHFMTIAGTEWTFRQPTFSTGNPRIRPHALHPACIEASP